MGKKGLCRDCELSEEREVPPKISEVSGVVFVGESPGKREIIDGEPFVGPAGARQKGVEKEAGIDPEIVSYANAARCLIDTKHMTDKEISHVLKMCREKFEGDIRKARPKVIVCLGKYALLQTMGLKGLESKKGEWFYSEEFKCPVFVMNHPSATLRDPGKLPTFKKHMGVLAKFISNGYKRDKPKTGRYIAVSSIGSVVLSKRDIASSIDTETEGLDPRDPNSPVLCYSVSFEPGVSYVVWLCAEVPLDNADFTIKVERRVSDGGKKIRREFVDVGIKRFPDYQRRLDELREFLMREDIKKTMANGVYDMLRFKQLLGKYVLKSFVMSIDAAAHVLDENTYIQASLEELQKDFSDMEEDQKDLFSQGGYDKADMLSVPPAKVTKYAGADADGTTRCYATIRKKLLSSPRQANYYANFLQPVIQNVLYPLSSNGVTVDMKELPTAKAELEGLCDKFRKRCIQQFSNGLKNRYKSTGKGIVLTRKDIIRDHLFDRSVGFGLESTVQIGGGGGSVGKDALILLTDTEGLPKEARVFIDDYLKYQEYHTLLTRYIAELEDNIHPDGRIYSSYAITRANTGRLASSHPNTMNFPKRSESAKYIRRLLRAPDGWVLIEADYDQSELRWAAHVSQDPVMIVIFNNNGDIHNTTAEGIVHVDLSKLSPKEAKEARRNAKPVNFGFIYGMQAPGFKRFVRTDYGIFISLDEAFEWREAFFNLYPALEGWHARQIAMAQKFKMVVSPFGRIRHLPMIDSDDYSVRGLAERQSINAPIQSVSSDSALLAASEVVVKSRLDPRKSMLTFFLHDALIYAAKEGYEDHLIPVLEEEMTQLPFDRFGVEMTVPLKAKFEIGVNLERMKEYGTRK